MPAVAVAKTTPSLFELLRGLPRRPLFGPTIVAAFAWFLVVGTLGPNGGGPGLTCDEYYDAAAGKALVRALLTEGLGFFRFDRIDRNYGGQTLHPPLGRWLLGLAHEPFDVQAADRVWVWMPGARLAPATAFAVLVFMVGAATVRVAGAGPGIVASLSLLLLPRAFAHAHFATLDTFQAMFSFAAIWAFWRAAQDEAGSLNRYAAAGVVWGLALLTKINGVLLAPPLVAWLLWTQRGRALKPLLAWSTIAAGVFFVAWPWLWPDPIGRPQTFLSTATDRQPLHNFYLGTVWRDVDTPWHYPWVMTAVTIPIGLLLLGLAGAAWRGLAPPAGSLRALALVNLLFVLVVFTLPGTPVYDGERLMLLVYPLWAVLCGLGCAGLGRSSWASRLPAAAKTSFAVLFLASQSVGLVLYHPFQLSYYNALVGGLGGAERLGFEVSYWGDAVDQHLIDKTTELAPGRPVLFAPQLAPFQAVATQIAFPQLINAAIQLVGWDPARDTPEQQLPGKRILVYHRRAEREHLQPILTQGRVLAENSRQGVWLSRLYEIPRSAAAAASKESP